jgi:glucan 1,3-beta-glucosidase
MLIVILLTILIGHYIDASPTMRALAPDFAWGDDPMRGVNIGGWLVLEPWITPSLFENKPAWVVDEWTYGAYMLGRNDTMSEIRHHWDTWFQYGELQKWAAMVL